MSSAKLEMLARKHEKLLAFDLLTFMAVTTGIVASAIALW